MTVRRWILILAIALTITACGGGGGSSDPVDEAPTDTATPSSPDDNTETQDKTFRVEVNFFGDGSITADGADGYVCDTPKLCAGTANAGSNVTFTATPNPGWEFNDWQNCPSATGNSCTLNPSDHVIVGAAFKRIDAPTLKSNVVILTADQLAAISDFNEDTGTVVFDAFTDLSNFDVGAVIVSQSSSTPFTQLVTNVQTKLGYSSIVSTVSAPLDQVIASGTLSFRHTVTAEEIESSLAEGVTLGYAPRKLWQTSNLIPLNVDVTAAVLKAKGDVVFGYSIATDIDFGDKNEPANEYRFSVGASVEGELALTAALETDSDNANLYLLKEIVPSTTFGIPSTTETGVYLSLTMGGTLQLLPKMELGADLYYSGHFVEGSGWRQFPEVESDRHFDIKDELPNIDVDPEKSINFEFSLGVEAKQKLAALLGPSLALEVFGGGELKATGREPHEDCTSDWFVYHGGRASAGAEMKFLSRGWDFKVELGEKKIALNDYSIGCSVRDTENPTAPENLKITTHEMDALTLQWEASEDNVGLQGYRIYRDGSEFQSNSEDPIFRDNRLKPNTRYCYQVQAIDLAGLHSGMSSQVCGTTLPTVSLTQPKVPTNLQAWGISSESVTLAWDYLSELSDFDVFMVYAQLDSAGGDFELVDVVDKHSQNTTLSGLSEQKDYCFQVSAFNNRSGKESERTEFTCTSTLAQGAHTGGFIVNLKVGNGEPTIHHEGNLVMFDATGSYDIAQPDQNLSYRWDFEGDGIWDTSWATTPAETIVLKNHGYFTASVEVRNGEGMTGSHSVDYMVSRYLVDNGYYVTTKSFGIPASEMEPIAQTILKAGYPFSYAVGGNQDYRMVQFAGPFATEQDADSYGVQITLRTGIDTNSFEFIPGGIGTDSDGDKIPDYWERINELDENNASDADLKSGIGVCTYYEHYITGRGTELEWCTRSVFKPFYILDADTGEGIKTSVEVTVDEPDVDGYLKNAWQIGTWETDETGFFETLIYISDPDNLEGLETGVRLEINADGYKPVDTWFQVPLEDNELGFPASVILLEKE